MNPAGLKRILGLSRMNREGTSSTLEAPWSKPGSCGIRSLSIQSEHMKETDPIQLSLTCWFGLVAWAVGGGILYKEQGFKTPVQSNQGKLIRSPYFERPNLGAEVLARQPVDPEAGWSVHFLQAPLDMNSKSKPFNRPRTGNLGPTSGTESNRCFQMFHMWSGRYDILLETRTFVS